MIHGLEFGAIFVLASYGVGGAIPFGLAAGLHPLAVVITSLCGECCGCLLTIIFFSRLRDYLLRRAQNRQKIFAFLNSIWDSHGLLLFGCVAPSLTGAPIAAVIAIFLGADRKKIVPALMLGTIIANIIWLLIFRFGFDVYHIVHRHF